MTTSTTTVTNTATATATAVGRTGDPYMCRTPSPETSSVLRTSGALAG